MTAFNFLKNELEKIAKNFTHIQIRYEFNKMIECHIVEFTPEYEYYHNQSLDSAWIPLSLRFMELFPEQEIAFVSSDSTLKVQEPVFIFNAHHVMSFDVDKLYDMILNHSIQADFANTSFRSEIPSSSSLIVFHSDITLTEKSNNAHLTTLAINDSPKAYICTESLSAYLEMFSQAA